MGFGVSDGGTTDTATRHGKYYFDTYSLSNSSAPNYVTLTATSGSDSATFPAYVAKTAEAFTHYYDGNLLSDGR